MENGNPVFKVVRPNPAKAPDDKVMVSLWIHSHMVNDLKEIALDNERSMSAEIRIAIRKHIMDENG